MHISTCVELLAAARQQTEPQRLRFVVAGAERPERSTPGERSRLEAGQGGAPAPLIFVTAMTNGRDAEAPWQRRVENINRGAIGNVLSFSPQGEALRLG